MMMPAQAGFAAYPIEAPALPRGFPPGWGLRAHCAVPACGATASIDPAPWLAQDLAGLPLERLETRLRCVCCGARRSRLEIAPLSEPPKARPAIYAFC